jgi:hypothetical protein
MRSLIVKFLFIACVLGVSMTGYAQTYTVQVKVNDAWWMSEENWACYDSALIFCNGGQIPDNGNYKYTWYFYSSLWGYYKYYLEGGRGFN